MDCRRDHRGDGRIGRSPRGGSTTGRWRVSVLVRCPQCQAQLNVRDELSGKMARCPKCNEQFRIGAEPAKAKPLPSLDFDRKSDAPTPQQPKKLKRPPPKESEDEFGSIEAPRL